MADARKQLKEKICPVCGRNYIFRDHWAYKIIKDEHVTCYCSWKCMRKAENENCQGQRKDGIHGMKE